MWHCWANHTYRKPNVLCKLQLLLPIPYTGFTFTPHGWTEWLGRNRRKAFADVEGRTKHRFTFKCTYTEKKKNFFFLQSGIVSWRLTSTNFFQVLLDIREKVNLDFFFTVTTLAKFSLTFCVCGTSILACFTGTGRQRQPKKHYLKFFTLLKMFLVWSMSRLERIPTTSLRTGSGTTVVDRLVFSDYCYVLQQPGIVVIHLFYYYYPLHLVSCGPVTLCRPY